jgi:hypothetical protein
MVFGAKRAARQFPAAFKEVAAVVGWHPLLQGPLALSIRFQSTI